MQALGVCGPASSYKLKKETINQRLYEESKLVEELCEWKLYLVKNLVIILARILSQMIVNSLSNYSVGSWPNADQIVKFKNTGII